MPNINFIDAPAGVSSETACVGATDPDQAKDAIIKSWSNWLKAIPPNAWPTSVQIQTSKLDLSHALVADNQNNVPYPACRSLIQAPTNTNGNFLEILPDINNASVRLKSIASELVSIAATIHTAQQSGHTFCGSRSDINTILGTLVWDYRWPKNHGPDYLFSDNNGNLIFAEVKGEVFTPDSTLLASKLKVFAEHKVQSINAKFYMPFGYPPPPSIRYVLSRVRHDSNKTITVRWFNHRVADGDKKEDCDAIVLATALSNYRQILRSIFGDYKVPFIQFSGNERYLMHAKERTWESQLERFGFVALIPLEIVRIFSRIDRLFYRLRKNMDNNKGFKFRNLIRFLKEEMLAFIEIYEHEDKRYFFDENIQRNLNWLPMGIVVYEQQPNKLD